MALKRGGTKPIDDWSRIGLSLEMIVEDRDEKN